MGLLRICSGYWVVIRRSDSCLCVCMGMTDFLLQCLIVPPKRLNYLALLKSFWRVGDQRMMLNAAEGNNRGWLIFVIVQDGKYANGTTCPHTHIHISGESWIYMANTSDRGSLIQKVSLSSASDVSLTDSGDSAPLIQPTAFSSSVAGSNSKPFAAHFPVSLYSLT